MKKDNLNSEKNKIIVELMITIVVMGLCYIPVLAFNAKYSLVDGVKDWEIRTTIDANSTVVGSAYEEYKAYTVGNTIYFGVILKKPGDYIVYEVNVANCGRMDARLDNMLVSYDNKNNSNGTIKYTITGIEHNDIIKAGENKKIYIKVEWDSNSKNYTSDVSSNILVNLQFVQN